MKFKVLIVFTMILSLGTIYQCSRNKQLKDKLDILSLQHIDNRVDTIYLDKPFRYTSLKKTLIPAEVLVYTGSGSRPDINKTLFHNSLSNPNTDSVYNQDSVIQVKINKDVLDLTVYKTQDSIILTNRYKLDLNKYQYVWNNGKLTYKKDYHLKLNPYLKASYRPLNNFYDLGGGISFNIRKLDIKAGVNLGYYPSISHKPYKDIEVELTYNF